MPTYSYTAKRGPTESVSGEIEAASEEQALSRLEEMGLVPVKIAISEAIKRDSTYLRHSETDAKIGAVPFFLFDLKIFSSLIDKRSVLFYTHELHRFCQKIPAADF